MGKILFLKRDAGSGIGSDINIGVEFLTKIYKIGWSSNCRIRFLSFHFNSFCYDDRCSLSSVFSLWIFIYRIYSDTDIKTTRRRQRLQNGRTTFIERTNNWRLKRRRISNDEIAFILSSFSVSSVFRLQSSLLFIQLRVVCSFVWI